MSILFFACPNSSQICSMGLQSGDLAGCSSLMTLLRCGIVFLVVVVISGKCHIGVSQNTPVELP